MRVVVADGHPTMRLGLKGLLLLTDVRVVGEAGDGEEVLRLVESLQPDLVILDLNLSGGLDAIDACRRIKALPNAPYVLIHTAYNFTDDVSWCLLAGADSYLHKRACCQQLLEAIHRTTAGERVWQPAGARMGEPHLRVKNIISPERGMSFTPKEREIAVLMLRSCSNTQIAEELGLSVPTVKTHVRNILRKLGLKSRRELIQSGAVQT